MGRWNWVGRRGRRAAIVLAASVSCASVSCSTGPVVTESPRTIQIQQTWQLQPGDSVGNYQIAAGLGDISIELDGGKVYAPFDGRVQPNVRDCVLFSSPDVPAYLFRLCGLQRPRLGQVKQGTAIGSGQYLHFATLRKLPEGTWTIVEPSESILEQLLNPS
ncbi:MAG: hypothetical protein EDM05_62535 [Leptolyngbya sp. IPPAS B-1204]|uniref:Lipoprotein n=1 Tax=Leptolyngbya sp. NK1-12 TaxID=2547451 RepID=A0AA97AHI5_9CYAN|nr:hypothetical protein [Leptolyngbya sp. NK1-12]MBF2050992.1 hypothetical protein [Elainella sp. C42_A2020_010]RNJ66837.1 MAG: hypothetical protein EDM05_23515 [Leptolyngbya sp. IPPAS B-1204]WNZ22786.1 hypothetical protein HJG54_07910 [Leptolyngbya sp. NK1-12]